MRTVVTFILRLWIDPQGQAPGWEGQVECVRDGARTHVCSAEDLVRFIEAEAGVSREHPHSQHKENEQ